VISLVAATLPMLPGVIDPARAAASNPTYTLEGCKNDGTMTFPEQGPFVCDSTDYTTGNLKTWQELDNVPFQVTLTAPVAGTATLGLAGDHKYGSAASYVGFDYVSIPVLSPDSAGLNCPTPSSVGYGIKLSSNGGVYDTIQRDVAFTGAQNATGDCTYDFYMRLALGSSNYSGSSLQGYVNSGYSGEKRVPLPVPPGPQTIHKTMIGTQNSTYTWDIAKSANPTSLTFNNTCADTNGSSQNVDITVSWTRFAATPSGDIDVVVDIYAKNDAARPLNLSISDAIYSGTTLLFNRPTVTGQIGARSDALVAQDHFTVPAGTTNLNDIATATYSDPVVAPDLPVITGTATATANAVITTATAANATATVTDSESLTTGQGLTFSVAAPSSGSFAGYTPGTSTNGPVVWNSGTLSGSGSVVFHKTVYAAYGTAGSGTLSDTATLTPANSAALPPVSKSVPITSSSLGRIDITKTIPNVLSGSETATFTIQVSPGATFDANNVVGSTTFTFTAGQTSKTQSVTGLPPGTYTLHELAVPHWQPQPDQTKTLSGTGASACVNTATFNNGFGNASAAAKKVTVPAGSQGGWSFTLTRPDATTVTLQSDSNGDVNFGLLAAEGTYTITETQQADWDKTGESLSVNGTTISATCSFTVNYPVDEGKAFLCTMTNTRRGHIVVYKHTDPAGDTQGFVFTPNYNSGVTFTLHDGQNNDSGALVPCGSGVGCYNVSEAMPTGWRADPNHPTTCFDGTTSYSAGAIELKPGKTVTCDFYNQKKGHVRVVKTFNGATLSGADAFTFQLRSGATTSAAGTVIESQTTNAGNAGDVTFAAYLNPGATYQLCETGIPVNWHSTLSDMAGAFSPGPAPADNSTVCVNFTVNPGETKTFTVNNTRPGGDARTIGYWKNWSSCKTSGGKQAPILDRTLAKSEPGGIAVGSLVLHGDVNNPNVAPSCGAAVRLLNKSRVDTGAKSASDPVFNFAAQYVAARLNYVAGAKQCPAATTAMNSGQALLVTLHFNGSTHDVLTSAQKTQLNQWASTLDQYNNNNLC
jgi:hypothetical protein